MSPDQLPAHLDMCPMPHHDSSLRDLYAHMQQLHGWLVRQRAKVPGIADLMRPMPDTGEFELLFNCPIFILTEVLESSQRARLCWDELNRLNQPGSQDYNNQLRAILEACISVIEMAFTTRTEMFAKREQRRLVQENAFRTSLDRMRKLAEENGLEPPPGFPLDTDPS